MDFIQICLNILIVFWAICVILMSIFLIISIFVLTKVSKTIWNIDIVLKDISEQYFMIKNIASMPFKLVADFLMKK